MFLYISLIRIVTRTKSIETLHDTIIKQMPRLQPRSNESYHAVDTSKRVISRMALDEIIVLFNIIRESEVNSDARSSEFRNRTIGLQAENAPSAESDNKPDRSRLVRLVLWVG